MTIRNLLVGAVDLILPRYCTVCGRRLLIKERHLCLECAMKMPLTYFWTERINPMADKFNEKLAGLVNSPEQNDDNAVWGEGAEAWYETMYSYAMALFFYKGKYRGLTKAIKYKYDISLGRYLGEALGRKVAECEWMRDVDLVVPVPLHPLRKFVRGYNQAQVIAEALTEELIRERTALQEAKPPVICRPELLYRNRRTKSQARLHMSQKSDNVKGAFSVKIEPALEREHAPSHILLVDDVFTSGATLGECQKALRKALVAQFGAAGLNIRISIATLACVGD